MLYGKHFTSKGGISLFFFFTQCFRLNLVVLFCATLPLDTQLECTLCYIFFINNIVA